MNGPTEADRRRIEDLEDGLRRLERHVGSAQARTASRISAVESRIERIERLLNHKRGTESAS